MENQKRISKERLEEYARTNKNHFLRLANVYERNDPEYFNEIIKPIMDEYENIKDDINLNQNNQKKTFSDRLSVFAIYFFSIGICFIIILVIKNPDYIAKYEENFEYVSSVIPQDQKKILENVKIIKKEYEVVESSKNNLKLQNFIEESHNYMQTLEGYKAVGWLGRVSSVNYKQINIHILGVEFQLIQDTEGMGLKEFDNNSILDVAKKINQGDWISFDGNIYIASIFPFPPLSSFQFLPNITFKIEKVSLFGKQNLYNLYEEVYK